MDLIYVAAMAMLISFLGQLPLGNMNITSTQIAVQEGLPNAWKFALGITLVEIAYLRLSLVGTRWVIEHETLFIALGWITVVLFLALGIYALFAAVKKKNDKAFILKNNINRFLLGISMSAINPVQIPFWFLWSTYLMNAGILKPVSAHFNFFIAGAGIGTLLGEVVYIHGGKWLIEKLKAGNKTLNQIMGAVFIVTALIQLYRMLFVPFIKKAA